MDYTVGQEVKVHVISLRRFDGTGVIVAVRDGGYDVELKTGPSIQKGIKTVVFKDEDDIAPLDGEGE